MRLLRQENSYPHSYSHRRFIHLGWFEGIIAGKMDTKKENPAGEGTVRGTHDGGLPVEHVIPNGTGGTLRRRVPTQVLQLFGDALESHCK